MSLRDVAAVVQRGEMVLRIAEEIEAMIVELGVEARLLRFQLDEPYGDIEDELDLVINDYVADGRSASATLAEMAALSDDEVLDLRTAAAALHRDTDPRISTKKSPRRDCACSTGYTDCRTIRRRGSSSTSAVSPACSGPRCPI